MREDKGKSTGIDPIGTADQHDLDALIRCIPMCAPFWTGPAWKGLHASVVDLQHGTPGTHPQSREAVVNPARPRDAGITAR